ncbi:hypothetical protein CDCA_CDCA10G3001 [Cyanidium caldarium]|uniref:Photosystem I subunit O n=1 Tax=Cyanidium caldarium TaxID=2771 RepID=A0AAV9IXU9_CYACA|nr:hypothetical protein CDCA_CDCA10G3001 [Cyanidium caldarium]
MAFILTGVPRIAYTHGGVRAPACASAWRSTFVAGRPMPMARPRLAALQPRRVEAGTARSLRMFELTEGEKYPLNPVVIIIAVLAWSGIASVPSNIPLYGGTGLTQAFIASIQRLLAQYPTGPKMDDPFWLYCLLYHLGLFALLFYGQIGYTGYTKGLYTPPTEED